MSKIYQDTEGNYHDLTASNLAEWAPADESLMTQPLQTVAAGGEGGDPDGNPGGDTFLVGDGTGEALPDAPNQDGDTELPVERADGGTVGEPAPEATPVAPEPGTAKAKTRQQ